MDKLAKPGFLRREHQQDDYRTLSPAELANYSSTFSDVVFPLTEDQRYYFFRTMVWHHTKKILSDEDYKRMSRPKMISFFFASIWGCTFYYLQHQLQINPQRFYQQFLLTPWSALFVAIPFAIGLYYQKTQHKVYKNIFHKYVDGMSDEDLLRWDARLNPSKSIIYDYIIERNQKRAEVEKDQQEKIERLMNQA